MQFSKKELDEFKKIIKEDYGVTMDDKEAHRMASKVVNLFKIICQPVPKKE